MFCQLPVFIQFCQKRALQHDQLLYGWPAVQHPGIRDVLAKLYILYVQLSLDYVTAMGEIYGSVNI